MRKSVGFFKYLFVTLITIVSMVSYAAPKKRPSGSNAELVLPSAPVESPKWNDYESKMKLQLQEDRTRGISYIVSGTLGLAGGLAGSAVSNDEIEKGVYTIFQSIGIASIGYGAYTWTIGNEDRHFYELLQASKLSAQDKSRLLETFESNKKSRHERERVVRAITHGLIAGLNLYNASQSENSTLKSGLYFVGGVNLLAAVGYTFEF